MTNPYFVNPQAVRGEVNSIIDIERKLKLIEDAFELIEAELIALDTRLKAIEVPTKPPKR